MTTNTYQYGKYNCRAYKKPCGHGFEVGFFFGGSQIFVGNFIHAKEANAWWSLMNLEIRKFGKRYALPKTASPAMFSKFLENHIYKIYYAYLDRQFVKYSRDFSQACRTYERKFTQQRRNWPTNVERVSFRKTA